MLRKGPSRWLVSVGNFSPEKRKHIKGCLQDNQRLSTRESRLLNKCDILFTGIRLERPTVTNKPGTVTTSHSRNGKPSGMLLPETNAAP